MRAADRADVRKWGDKWVMEEILAARKTAECFGGMEYLVRWRGWEKPSWQVAGGLGGEWATREDRERAERDKRVCASFREWLERKGKGRMLRMLE